MPPDSARPDSALPDSARPDSARPDSARPDSAPPAAAAPTAIGIDIGGTHLRAALVRADGTILARARAASSPEPETVIARCLTLIAGVRDAGTTAIGIGVPGQVDTARQQVISGGHVDLSGLDVAARIGAATGLAVTLGNDAAMALLGEAALGAATGCRNVVMLTIGTGIGGAVLEGGRILTGQGLAGQLGHIVVNPGGRDCVCGRQGCVETESAGTAFARHLAEAGLPPGTRAEDLLARPDDRVAQAVLRAWAGPLRAAVETLISVCNPERVVIGGGAGAAAVAALALLPARLSWFSAPLVAARLGDDAGVTGAALAALRAGPVPKRLVMVNGVPASGKSALARALAARTGWPVIALDTVKAPFLTALAPVERPFNRRLGQAGYQAIFGILADAPPGAVLIVDAWFGFQPAAVLSDGLARAGVTDLAEIWCHAPPEVIGARYAARVAERPAGHPGLDYVPELMALARRAVPMALGPLRRVETTAPVDIAALAGWLEGLWPAGLRP